MFYPGSGPEHFLIPDLIQTFFHPGSYMKSGMQKYFFSCFSGFQDLILVTVKKIRGLGSGKNSSRIRIPDPGGKISTQSRSRNTGTGNVVQLCAYFVPFNWLKCLHTGTGCSKDVLKSLSQDRKLCTDGWQKTGPFSPIYFI
jgi:hypothetical protein